MDRSPSWTFCPHFHLLVPLKIRGVWQLETETEAWIYLSARRDLVIRAPFSACKMDLIWIFFFFKSCSLSPTCLSGENAPVFPFPFVLLCVCGTWEWGHSETAEEERFVYFCWTKERLVGWIVVYWTKGRKELESAERQRCWNESAEEMLKSGIRDEK